MTWANQVKILKNQLQQLGIIFGQTFINAFRPALKAMNSFLSAVISFAQQVFNALGAIFGWKIEITSSGIKDELGDVADTVGDISDGAGGAGDGLGKAAKNAKDLKQQLQGFDKLNLLTTDKNGGSGGSGGKGGSGGSGGSGGGGGGASGDDLSVKVTRQENPIFSNIKSLFSLGEFVGNTIADSLNSINWDAIRLKARSFGTGLASFLNGFFNTDAMSATGRTIAQSLNTALEALYGFGSTFSWTQFGEECAKFVTEIFDTFDWKLAADTIDEWVQGIAEAIKSFLGYIIKHPDKVLKGLGEFALELDGKTIVLLIAGFTLRSLLKGGAIAAAVKALLFGTGGSVSVGGVTAATQVSKAVVSNSPSFFASGGIVGAVKAWAAPILANPITIGAAGVAIVGTVMYEAHRFLIEGKQARNDLEQGIYDWISGRMKKVQERLNKGEGEEGLEYKPEVFVNPKMPNIDNINDNNTKGGGIGGAIQQLREGLRVAFGKEPIKLESKVSIDKDKLNIKKMNKTVSKLFGTAELNAKGKYTTGDKDVKVWKKDTATAWNKYAKDGLRIGAKYGTTSKDADAWYRQTKTAWGTNRSIELSGKITKAVDMLTVAQKTFNTTSKFSGSKDAMSLAAKTFATRANMSTSKDALSLAAKTFNTRANMSSAKDSMSIGNKTFTSKANMTSAKDSMSTGNKTFNSKANMTSAKDSISSAQKTLTAKAKFTSWTKTFSIIDGLKAKFTSWTKTFSTISGLAAKFTSWFRADGGVYSNGKWTPIQRYAEGGSPTGGQLFVAREAGPELVGSLGGHTAVMNNDQIVASVSAGVAKANQAEIAILRQQNQILSAILSKRSGIDADSIFNAVRAKDANYKQRTGRSAFSY